MHNTLHVAWFGRATRLALTVDPEVLEEEYRQNVGHRGTRGGVAASGEETHRVSK